MPLLTLLLHPEQKARFGAKFAAMAITEPGAGSDTAAITTTAKLDPETNEWILNGEKIFVTSGYHSEAVVVWATLDRSQGRAAIKSFVVEKGTPGMTVTKLEHKLGIRASDTASIVLQDCRIPHDNILGSAEITERKEGLGGAMATFDATRPGVAAMAIGVARASLEFTKEKLEGEGYTFPYDVSQHKLNYVQKTMMEMEANLDVARLLNWRAASMLDDGLRNSLEASIAKAKAGRAATLVTQKCVELLGPLGYSREWLVEKWMRDSKITDIFEGTGQIQMLVIARNDSGIFSRNVEVIKAPEFFVGYPRGRAFFSQILSVLKGKTIVSRSSTKTPKKLLIVLTSNLIESLNYPTVRFINPDVSNHVD